MSGSDDITRARREGSRGTDTWHILQALRGLVMEQEPAVAVAVVDGALPAGVVQGQAVGVPVTQVSRGPTLNPNSDPVPSSAKASAPVEGYIYSDFMAKVFAGIDADKSGTIEEKELAMALEKLGLDESKAKEAFDGIDKNGDGKIQLSEWESGLDPQLRAAIEAKADALSGASS